LHTSQPNISRVIAKLQKETGLKLFERVGLRLVPTPEAEALLREVERAYVGLQTIRDAADSIKTMGAGGLRIAVSPALAIGLMPQAVQVFRERHPHVRVSVYTSDSATVCKWTAAGYCDFGVVSYVPDVPDVTSKLLHRQRAVCIVPAGHRLARKRSVRAADLEGEPFISMAQSDHTRQKIDAAFVPDKRRLELETPHAATICVMVARGLGVSIINPLVFEALALPGLKAIPFEPAIHFTCASVHAQQRLEQGLVTEFLAAVKQVF
jgi:DNA-binding transcriptional LysR family regulator